MISLTQQLRPETREASREHCQHVSMSYERAMYYGARSFEDYVDLSTLRLRLEALSAYALPLPAVLVANSAGSWGRARTGGDAGPPASSVAGGAVGASIPISFSVATVTGGGGGGGAGRGGPLQPSSSSAFAPPLIGGGGGAAGVPMGGGGGGMGGGGRVQLEAINPALVVPQAGAAPGGMGGGGNISATSASTMVSNLAAILSNAVKQQGGRGGAPQPPPPQQQQGQQQQQQGQGQQQQQQQQAQQRRVMDASNAAHEASIKKQQSARMLLIFHAIKCGLPDGSCPSEQCAYFRSLWPHMESCRTEGCARKHCVSSRYCLDHFNGCKEANCTVCVPVRDFLRANNNGDVGAAAGQGFRGQQPQGQAGGVRRPADPYAPGSSGGGNDPKRARMDGPDNGNGNGGNGHYQGGGGGGGGDTRGAYTASGRWVPYESMSAQEKAAYNPQMAASGAQQYSGGGGGAAGPSSTAMVPSRGGGNMNGAGGRGGYGGASQQGYNTQPHHYQQGQQQQQQQYMQQQQQQAMQNHLRQQQQLQPQQPQRTKKGKIDGDSTLLATFNRGQILRHLDSLRQDFNAGITPDVIRVSVGADVIWVG